MQQTSRSFILIDESGTLPDPNDEFIVIVGIGLEHLQDAEDIMARLMKALRERRKRVRELKFYYASERLKKQILSGIAGADLEIFLLVVDKRGRKISDSPENYSVLVGELIKAIYIWKKTELAILADKHFHRTLDEELFNTHLQTNLTGVPYSIEHVNSQEKIVVNLADFVAGAALAKYNKNREQFYTIVKDSILFEKIISWPELKRKSLAG